MRANFWLTRKWLLVFSILFLGVMEARAEVMLSDTFSVTGFLRHQVAVHTGETNPNNASPNATKQTDRNTLNLSRTFFQTEWTYLPNDAFKLYSKVKLISDQTEALDSDLKEYNAFPLGTPRYGTYLRATDDKDLNAEMSELYADVSLGNLWVRLGKQQIVWGEMISSRILDIINPLDLSWHFQFEPEEFENIRVPQWALRARYNVPRIMPLRWLKDVYFEGFVNPGDVSPQVFPAPGSPYNVKPTPPTLGPGGPPVFKVTETDRRGDAEYGFRIGGGVGQVFGTLNYLSLYSKSGFWERKGGGPAPPNLPVDNEYPKTDLYGASLNYSFPYPINVTATYEALYSPDEPYYDATSPLTVPHIVYKETTKHAIRFDRSTFVLPRPISAMMIQLQFSQTMVKDNGQVKTTPAAYSLANNVDSAQNTITLNLSQDLWHNNINLSFLAVYDLDDAHYIRPGFKYKIGNHWIFDIYGVILGGAEARTGRFASMYWADEVFGRITYQF